MSEINNDMTLQTDVTLFELDDYYVLSESDASNNEELGIPNHESKSRMSESQDDSQCDRVDGPYWRLWEEFYNSKLNADELGKTAVEGGLRKSRFRSICWRYMLGILHSEPELWPLELRTLRTHYNDMWVELEPNPRNVETALPDNPLSQKEESVWHKYFNNEELKSLIQQDVVRTFPGVEFFREQRIQRLMVKILFCYARQNPSLCYRQGMHEILAPLIFVLHCDHQAMLKAKEQIPSNGALLEILDPKYMEEDAYSMFKHVMNHMESSYRIKNVITETGYFSLQVTDDDKRENEVITRLQYIKDNILRESDPDLNKHLDDLDISLQLFGIRWLRLLFGREFPFKDLLVLWDAIFAISNFELVNYVVVAMLTAIRTILLAGDYTKCLTSLMRYPSGVDVMFVIEYALHLMSPSAYPTPAVTSFHNEPVTLIQKSKRAARNHLQPSENNDSPSLKLKFRRPFRRGKGTSGKSYPSGGTTGYAGGHGHVEGPILNEPKVPKSESERQSSPLRHVQTKLLQYHKSLSASLSEPLSPEVKLALDGIYELCSYLKACQDRSNGVEIERALEAGDVRQADATRDNRSRSARKLSNPINVSDADGRAVYKTRSKTGTVELKVMKRCEEPCDGGATVGVPKINPVRLMKVVSCDSARD